MKVIEAPNSLDGIEGTSVFLAGSIEMGTAEKWQDKIIAALQDNKGTLLNPRRHDWDSTWEQTRESPQFVKQIRWELSAMEKADIIVYYFDPATKSPITLLELGLYARSKKRVIVCCKPEFWRSGNICVVCYYYNLLMISSLEALTDMLRHGITK